MRRFHPPRSAPLGSSLIGLFEEQAGQHLGRIALRRGAETLDYRGLQRLAGRVAAGLRSRGAGPGRVIAVALARDSFALIGGLLGVLRCGATVLMLDPELPSRRLAFLLADSGASLVLADAAAQARLPAAGGVPVLDIEALPAEPDAQPPAPAAELAYLVYTSGSTGQPKGVAMRQQAIVELIRWQCEQSGPERAARTLQSTPAGFDVFFQEVFAALAAGGELVLVDDGTRLDPRRLLALLDEQAISRLFLPFVALQQLAEAGVESGAAPRALREVITAGERLIATPALRRWFRALPACRLVNQYGPSETHVVSQQLLAADPQDWPELPPIGLPAAGAELRVLGPDRRPVADGAEGELWIGGSCLAAGYHGRPDLTAERFVEDLDFGDGPRRYYRSGDLVRRGAGGALEFLGRADEQIKLRGYRIEPGEVEAALAEHEDVAQAVVALATGPRGPRLVAWILPRPGRAPGLGALRRHLEERLPAYAVPASLVLLESLPRTGTGKVDRRALPAPGRARPPLEQPAVPPANDAERTAVAVWAELLALDEVGVEDNFYALGGDSLTAVRMAQRLGEALGREVPVTAPFQRPTIRGLLGLLAGDGAEAAEPRAQRAPGGAIAVIGMELRVPGAVGVEEFWRLLLAGRDGITRFTVEELRAAGIAEDELSDPDYVRARGCIEGALAFDAEFFGMSPREAALTDPQQRLFLQTCWSALEQAGYAPDAAPGAVGVWGGVSTGMNNDTYLQRVLNARPGAVGAGERLAAMLGNQNDYLTTRVSHKLGLRGPSVSVQSACSTSLVAIAQACESLRAGQCDLALAGGACVLFPQQGGYLRQEGDIGSSDGACRPFDARADGTVFGDGVGVVVLKRLADALADGDAIRAVIRGVAVNNDGAERMSFGAPSAEGQAAVVRAALADAGVAPAEVGFVEAHGTATPVGDPIEVAGLCQAFGALPPASCALGAVKSQVGHLIAAAGVTGFIKAVLATERGVLPPTAHFERPHPDLHLERTPFFVHGAPADWPRKEGPRRAGVSSFGLGGTNAHVVIEQAPEAARHDGAAPERVLLPLAGPDADALAEEATALAASFEGETPPELADAAFTLQQGRSGRGWRRAVVAASATEAAARLRGAESAAGGDRQMSALLGPRARPSAAPRAVFLFPGGGAQHAGMARELRRTQPVVRETMDRGLDALPAALGAELRRLWFEGLGDAEADAAAWQRPSLQLPALYLLEVALARLWISWGIEPAALLGHSMGEYTAAHLAGVFSFEDGLGLVALRGRLFETLAPGAMLSVALGEESLRVRLGAELDLAVVNGEESCIASGPRPALERLAQELEREGVDASFVRIEVASHSRCVDPILAEFDAYLRSLELRAPRIPVASNRSGGWLTAEEATSADYWVGHLRQTVRFADNLRLVTADPAARLIEAGPGRTLTSLARPYLDAASGQIAIPSMKHAQQSEGDLEVALGALGAAWCAGFAVDWEAVLPAAGRRRIPLPGTAFRRRIHLAAGLASGAAVTPAVAACVVTSTSSVPSLPPPALPAAPPSMDSATRRERIRNRLAEILGGLSGLDPATLDPAKPFLEMGFDSLFLTQASLGFKKAFRVKITFRQLFDTAPTIDALAEYVDGALPAGAEVDGAVAPAPAATGALAASPGAAAAVPELRSAAGDRPLKFVPFKPIERGRDGGLTERQREHLDALIQRVLERTPKSKQLTAIHRAHFADPRAVAGFRTLWKEIVYPIAVERSKGARMWDVDGNEYVDCVGGFGAILFGHAPDFLVEATIRQARQNLDYGPTSPIVGELAGRIARMTGMDRVSFCNTGTEAVLATVRLARTVTGRDKIVVFAGDYHGLHDEVLVKLQDGPAGPQVVPSAPGIPQAASANVIVLEYGDPASLDAVRAHAGELAAVLVEPVQSRAPELQPREFVQRLRRLTEELGVPLIFDEIITGFRTGPGGAQEYYGVRADLAAYGKVIGAGMPIGIVAGRAEYMDALDGGDWRFGDDSFPEAGVTYFAGTFMRHPLALAAVAGALDRMEREGPALQRRLNHRIAAFSAELNDAFERARLPIFMRHFASMIYPKYGSDPEFEDLWFHHLRVRGVHLWAGRPGFLTTEHGEAELAFLREQFLAAAEAMVEGGFLKRRDAPVEETRKIPLTEAQEELWLTTRASAAAARALNEPCAFELRGELNLPALRRALRKVVARHDALRAALAPDGSGLIVHSVVPEVPIELHDLGGMEDSARAAERERIYREDSREPFDLSRAPLLRARLLRLAEDRHELLLTVHHVVCDGWSISIVFHDLGRLYSRIVQGRNEELEPAMQLADYRRWETEQQESDEHRATLRWWRERFADPPAPLELPLDAPRPPRRSYRGNRQTRVIGAELGAALKAFGAERKCTLFSVLLAGYVAFLRRLTGQEDLVLGIPSAGQALLGANSLVAHCVHYLPLRVAVGADESFTALVERMKAEMLEVNERQDFTFGTLLKSLRLPRDASRPTLISADFNLDPAMEGLEFAGLEARYVSTPRDFARLELMFNLIEDRGELLLECDHATDVISEATAARWMAEYEGLLRAALAEPERPLGGLQPGAAAESAAAPLAPLAAAFVPVHGLFAARAAATPDAIALCEGERALRYEELDRWSDDLARRLLARGLERGSRVGLGMHRSCAQIAALLAVWKAGGVAVPLDPQHPLERNRVIAARSGLAILLHHAAEPPLPLGAPQSLPVEPFPDAEALRAGGRAELPRVAPEATAYVLHTSGSTGVPKGVVVSHRSLAHLLQSFAPLIGAHAGECWLAVVAPTFDMSLVEVFVPLTVGARVAVAPGGTRLGGRELLALARSHRADVIQTTPSVWRMLLEAGLDAADGLRAIAGGEALRPALAAELGARCRESWNAYGPTEVTVYAAAARLRGDEDPVPIGAPLPGVELFLLDADLKPVADGAVGELCVAGPGLAEGYLGLPEETARVFVTSPHVGGGSVRLYRTGDLARRGADGAYYCLGRNDDQLKWLGHRIECGEVEAALERLPGVLQAAVGLRLGPGGEPGLVAWLRVAGPSQALDAAQLRARLAERLPRSMLPQRFVALAEFPLLSSGKVDRAALTEDGAGALGEGAAAIPDTEGLIAQIWARVLDRPEVGGDEDFFLLGGTSLLANRMLARVEEATGVQLELEQVFLHPTVRGLAEVVDATLYRSASLGNGAADAAAPRRETRL